MKQRSLNILAAIIAFSCCMSCSDFLSKDMDGIYSSDNYFKTEAHAQTALTGAYNMLLFNATENCIWVFGDIASDDATKGGLPGDQADIEFIERFETLPNNGFVEMFWQHHYEGVARCNNVVERTPQIEASEDRKNEIIAEAKFLRAYFYFQLVNVYGDIPLKLRPADNPAETHTPLFSVEQIYEQIEKDIQEAIEFLPITITGAEYGRASQGAAIGLLAKVKLFQGKWNEALEAALQVESMGYSLLPVYGDNFKIDHDNNSESIFEVQHAEGFNPMLGNILNQWFAPREENGYGFNVPTQNFVESFEVTSAGVVDPRLDYTLVREGKMWNGEPFDPSWSPTGYISKKHLQPLSEVSKGTKQDAGLNYTYMRLAEILLIKAEAYNELGMSEMAKDEINRLRKRSREAYLYDDELSDDGTIPEGLVPEIKSGSQDQIRQAVKHERRIELGMEFHRYFDLMRYGKRDAEEALHEHSFIYEQHRYFPIPQSERDTNNNIN
ncbi:RagB/SusD family nutrient uptake outer membrane protein [Aureibacter tunicatorum]|uniref:RagB/SusD family nutrient uptake outer membrane protein n=1 Tax=Aureibacter tunicatorum TaxID=866807 RepID=A0AAE3XT44_9BACT|nr:RagB/SusD family nutrient uptake outer membrane protein [Aureibacter tunicatorum]MDR6241529.1 hypothetical protein [Aureibacter tunicatorum]BDD07013.1 membrane protein [Aureibacter tunicatorum]